jgi:hypothetical protein
MHRGEECGSGPLRLWLLAIVLCGLLAHLGGRYTDFDSLSGSVNATTGTINPHHQHLDSDGAQWHPPTTTFALFVATICEAHVEQPCAPPLAVHVDESLYNRPPPVV